MLLSASSDRAGDGMVLILSVIVACALGLVARHKWPPLPGIHWLKMERRRLEVPPWIASCGVSTCSRTARLKRMALLALEGSMSEDTHHLWTWFFVEETSFLESEIVCPPLVAAFLVALVNSQPSCSLWIGLASTTMLAMTVSCQLTGPIVQSKAKASPMASSTNIAALTSSRDLDSAVKWQSASAHPTFAGSMDHSFLVP